MKICLHCKGNYSPLGSRPGRQKYCSDSCKSKQFRQIHPDRAVKNDLKQNIQRHGIVVDEYDRLLMSQNYKCAICGNSNPGKNQFGVMRFSIDHNHVTKEVRGLLCNNCNHLLGKSFDNIDILRAAIQYLENVN